MKEKLKSFLRWAGIFVLCLTVIYCFVFFGGWKFFESGDPILIEIGISLILSFFVFIFNETVTNLEKRIKTLEERADEAKKKNTQQK